MTLPAMASPRWELSSPFVLPSMAPIPVPPTPALPLHREAGQARGVAIALEGLAGTAICEGELERAITLLDEGDSIARDCGDAFVTSVVRRARAHALLLAGEEERARALLIEALALARQLRDLRGIADDLEGLAAITEQSGAVKRAARLLGAAAVLRGSVGARRPAERGSWYDSLVERIAAELAPEEFERQYHQGCALDLEEALELALGPWPRAAAA